MGDPPAGGAAAVPARAREIRAVSRPAGTLRSANFALFEVDVPDASNDALLVRNDFMGVSAIMGNLMGEGPKTPMPLYELDRPISGPAVGTVVRSASPDFTVGDLVQHRFAWRDYAWGPVGAFQKLDRAALPGPQYFLSQGHTAWRGMVDMAGVGEGDVVFVSGAAGGVGSMAGQIARCRGAARVIGSTGSPHKVDFLTRELGYDAAFDYHDGSVADRLRELAPDGLTVVFDNVGGAQFEAAIDAAAPGARIAICGLLSSQVGSGHADTYLRIDQFKAGLKELVFRTFATRPSPRWVPQFAQWLREGRMVFPHTVVDGLEAAPDALIGLRAGRYAGTAVVRLS